MRRETKSFPIAGLKAIDTETGQFEAIVSVFGNIDLHGHRIDTKAFDGSIERWQSNGDPIPVIFSHQWDDLSAYLGTVDPADLKALQPGDATLPEAVRDLGGLYVKGTLDTSEPEGRKAAKLLKSRAVREFSFAYDVLDEQKADDGFLDLLELDLIEVGPTLKGANPQTQLIGAKTADLAEAFDVEPAVLEEIVVAFKNLEGSDQPGPPADPEVGAKAFVTLDGTLERLQESLERKAQAWAAEQYGQNLYAVYIEGTYTDSIVFYVELWDDPLGGGRYFQADYSSEGDEITLAEPAPITITATPQPKRRGLKEGRRNAGADLERIQGIHDLTKSLGADCSADPDGADSGEPDGAASRVLAPGVLVATLDADLLEIE